MSRLDPTEYEALKNGAGLCDFRGRTLIELSGRDRATFLNNFCTNDVRRLAPGQGCEAFVTSVQGKVLGHVLVFCGESSLVIETVPGQAEKLIAHLDRYLIREDVTLVDRSAAWGELLLAGSASEAMLASRIKDPLPTERPGGVHAQLAGREVVIERVDMAGPVGFLLRAAAEDVEAVRSLLLTEGVVACGPAVADVVRIEAGWPLYGQDITEENLPQEVARDSQAISFVKGCYLGQETVARIDALGHVNRTLCRLRFTGDAVPAIGTELTAEGKPVGKVTSAAFSPGANAPVALGYVRRGHNTPGTPLQSAGWHAHVFVGMEEL